MQRRPPLFFVDEVDGRMARRIRWGLLTVLVVAVAAGLAGTALRGGTKELVRRPGAVLRLAARTEGLFWLEAPAEASGRGSEGARDRLRRLLFLARGASSPTVLVEAPGIADFCVGDAVYYVTADSLARVPRTGGSLTVLRAGLAHPTAVLAGDEWVCWTETQPARSFSLPVLPLTRPATLLRAMPLSGGEPLNVFSTDGEGDAVLQLLGLKESWLFLAEHRPQPHPTTLFKGVWLPNTTELLRLATAGKLSMAGTLSAEEGVHEGVLLEPNRYWTGGSREGAPAGAFTSVSVERSKTDSVRVELLGEWLPPDGVLRVDGDRAYYCRQGVYELPGDAGAARRLFAMEGAGPLTQIVGDNAYVVESEAGQGYRIVRRPLHAAGSWAARRGAVP
jgi:hypothetical protein